MKKYFLNFLALIFAFQLSAQNQPILHADLGKTKISKNIYGHFSEHLRKCIYGGFYGGEGNTKIANTNGIRTEVVEALGN